MSSIGLGRRKVTATKDTSGLNPGNWTCAFTHDVLSANVARFECYHMVAKDITGVVTLTTFVFNDVWSSAQLAGDAEWDPQQPLPLTPDDDVFLCFSSAATGTPPVCWMWLRYDPAI